MPGKLCLVGTPIGNLGDMSPRALRALEEADFIAAEDTRVTLKLLNHFNIKKPLVSYYELNARSAGERILERILAGENCALVTDAGMPSVSDPGEDLAARCAGAGVELTAVPGPCAAVTALALSALPAGRFCFEGFLSTSGRSRREHLESLKGERRTMVFYEAPHKLVKTLEDLRAAFGPGRRIALCREMTKLHEEVVRSTLGEAAALYAETPPRGEFVLVVEGAAEARAEFGREEALALVERRRAEGMSLKEACRLTAEETGIKKNELYQWALNA